MRGPRIAIPAAVILLLLFATGYLLVRHDDAKPAVPSTITLQEIEPGDSPPPAPVDRGAAPPPYAWTKPESPLTLALDPATSQFSVRHREDGGWEISPSPAAAGDRPDKNSTGPTAIYWAERQEVLLTWQLPDKMEVLLFDLTSGKLSTVRDAIGRGASLSPDGRLVSLQLAPSADSTPAWAVFDLSSGREVARLRVNPPVPDARWVGPNLIWQSGRLAYIGADDALLSWTDAAGGDWAAGFRNGAVCYFPRANALACLDTYSGARTFLQFPYIEGRYGDPTPFVSRADPSGRYLLFAYRRNHQTPPDPKPYCPPHAKCAPSDLPKWYDTLVIYDSLAGQAKLLTLPEAGTIMEAAWSADGAYVGFRFAPACADGHRNQRCEMAYWSLAVATRELRRMPYPVDPQHPSPGDLWWVQPDGALLLVDRQSAVPQVRRLVYGQQPEPWQADRMFFGFPTPDSASYRPANPPPLRALASIGQGTLTVEQPNGQVCSFNWASDLPPGGGESSPQPHVLVAPSCQWIALRQFQNGHGGQVTFLHP